MKKYLVVVLLVAVFTGPTSAESSGMFGIRGGLNFFNIYGNDVEQASYRTGLSIGGVYTHRFSEMFALQPEIFYSLKGSQNDQNEDIRLRLDYIEIPVLFRVNFPLKSTFWSPALFAGPYYAFLLNADLSNEVDATDQFNSTDYGLVVGAAFDYPQSEGTRNISFEFRYSVGFAKIDKEKTEEIYNNGFQFLLGYGFSL